MEYWSLQWFTFLFTLFNSLQLFIQGCCSEKGMFQKSPHKVFSFCCIRTSALRCIFFFIILKKRKNFLPSSINSCFFWYTLLLSITFCFLYQATTYIRSHLNAVVTSIQELQLRILATSMGVKFPQKIFCIF